NRRVRRLELADLRRLVGVPRDDLVEERVVVGRRRGHAGALLLALGPLAAPLDRAGGGHDAGRVLGEAGDLADDAVHLALGPVGEADETTGVGGLLTAAAADLQAVGIFVALADGPSGDRE